MHQPLVVVPTELERGIIGPVVAGRFGGAVRVELCGFGPVVAAARAARLVAEYRPRRVMLVGIAGRYDDRLAIGRACAFERVACHGVGAGVCDGFVPAASMGWSQWPGDACDGTSPIGDSLPCTGGPFPTGTARADLLLSVCAASAGDDDVRSRLRLHPEAAAEDMEGFAVAAACRLAGVPLDVVRGISNTAGDRDRSGWQVEPACMAAAELAATLLGERS